jgi:hypothetical protein
MLADAIGRTVQLEVIRAGRLITTEAVPQELHV